MNGTFSLMLHCHIPYCRKSGVWPAGEEWLFEAMHETYLPLLAVFRRFQQAGLKPRVMVGIVPILAEQLADRYMNDRFCEYLEDKIKRARRDVERFRDDPARQKVAEYYVSYFESTYAAYKATFYRDLLGTFKWLQEEGVVEVLTSAATHGFLPLMAQDSSIYSQVHLGVASYEKYFGRKPKGFWVPECAYRPREWSSKYKRERRGIDEWLADEGIRYFFVEHVGISRAEFVENKHHESCPTTFHGYRLESGVCVFGRNQATGKQVWSPDGGYPGDPDYREFHQRDSESGLHYWRVTRETPKQIYDPAKAAERVQAHADHFAGLLHSQVAGQKGNIPEEDPILVAPYDGELFGHWWHEGPAWVESLYQILLRQHEIRCASCDDYIREWGDTFSTIRMRPSTWGVNSDFTVWQNPEHGWIWPYINGSSVDLEDVITSLKTSRKFNLPRPQRLLKQLGRELLLMEGSDWPFLLFTTQAKDYANQRFHHHHQRFNKLLWAAKDPSDAVRLSDAHIAEMEDIDNPWPDVDVESFGTR